MHGTHNTSVTWRAGIWWLMAVLISSLVGAAPPAHAAPLNAVQSGTATIADGNTSTTATITSIDTTKAFLVFGLRLAADVPAEPINLQVSGQITDATTLTFARVSTTGTLTVTWYVAEFTSGISVQRGSVSLDSDTTINVTLTGVDTSKSFPIVTMRTEGTAYNDNDFVRAKITSSTNLELSMTSAGTNATAEWQVIEYTDATVQTGDVSFLSSESSKTATLSPSVDTAKSWLIYSNLTAIGLTTNVGQKLVQGVMTDSTTLTFDRENTGQTLDLTWYVVEFTDGTTVQQGSQNFTSTDTQQDVTISSVDTTLAIAAGGYAQRAGKSPYNVTDNPGVAWFTLDVTSATNLQITRGITESVTADVGWFVIQFIADVSAVELTSFTATRHQDGVLLRWRTGLDVDNLGWHVYREVGGERVQLTPELIAGSALMFGPGLQLHAGNAYRWWDPAGLDADRYWIKDRDLNGQWTWHGPVTPVATDEPLPTTRRSTRLSQVGRTQTSRTKARTAMATRRVRHRRGGAVRQVMMSSPTPQPWETPDLPPHTIQHALSAAPAIKLDIWETGWYRATQPELVAAGLHATVDPRTLQLFVQGQQLHMVVKGEEDGRFDPQDAIEFYGTGLDTPWTDLQTYWLVAGSQPGKRVPVESSQTQGTPPPQSFPATVEHKERTLYLAMVKNGEAENFFGAVIAQESVERVLPVFHLDPAPLADAQLEMVLQGVTLDSHQVNVQLNGHEVGTMDFAGQTPEVGTFPIPQAWLQDGENTVLLVPIGDQDDVIAVDSIRLTYWHTYTADNDTLRFTLPGHNQVTIKGFGQPDIRVVDVTYPQAVRERVGHVASQGTDYALTVTAHGEGERTLVAFTDAQVKQPAAVMANAPSTWHHDTQGADLVIISHEAFMDSVAPLKTLRESQGWLVALVGVEDVYDEFNFGHKSPWALRNFLHHASTTWQIPPRFVLLVGDASFDPHNYLELDDVDFVPTKLVETAFLETASDDALVDFDDDGVPELAVGRLPVRTLEETNTVVAKLELYAAASTAGSWTREALLVADDNDIFDFTGASMDVIALLPTDLRVEELLLDQTDVARSRSELLTRLNEGKLLVNYIGHGSTEVWAGGELLTSADARALTNGERLPVVVAMNCLNGFFQDLYTESLAEALLKAEQGGAVAVWASSGLTAPRGQAVMNQALMRSLFGEEQLTLGEAIIRAKAAATDRDVQHTWILFGDPTLRWKSIATEASNR